MNKLSMLLIITILSLLCYIWFADINNKDTVVSPQVSPDTGVVKAKRVSPPPVQRLLAKLSVDAATREVAEQLLPLDEATLKAVWEEEFGCYVLGFEAMPAEDLFSDECAEPLLTAGSLAEARWMQRHGYPSRSQLALLKDPEARTRIYQLAEQNFPPALGLVAVDQFSIGEYEEAANVALDYRAYSDKSKSFPYRLRGEALVANNVKLLGIVQLKVADLLGDVEAGYLYNQYVGSSLSAQRASLDNAYLYMSRVFGVLFEDFPSDPRPQGG